MSSIFLMILFILGLLYVVLKFRGTLKHLNGIKLLGILLLFLVFIGGAGVFLYYLGEWSTGVFENIFALVFTQFLSFLIVASVCFLIFHTILAQLASASDE